MGSSPRGQPRNRMITWTPLRRRVTGDLFHGKVPGGAVYVGRAAPGLPASKYANPFGLKRRFPRSHPLRRYLDAAILEVTLDLTMTQHDTLSPASPAVAAAAYRRWLRDQPDLLAAARAKLAGHDLACWCPLPEDGTPDCCHAVVLLEAAAGRPL